MKRNINFKYAVQIILAFVALLFGLSSFFINDFLYASQIFIALTFLMMAFNQYKIMNRKGTALVYFIISLLILIMAIPKVS